MSSRDKIEDTYESKPYQLPLECSDMLNDAQIPIVFRDEMRDTEGKLRVLSLFSGCGGMDLGFEGSFIAPRKSFASNSDYIEHQVNDNWVMLKNEV